MGTTDRLVSNHPEVDTETNKLREGRMRGREGRRVREAGERDGGRDRRTVWQAGRQAETDRQRERERIVF